MRLLFAFFALLTAMPALAHEPAGNRPTPGFVRVRVDTSEGPFVVAVDMRHAPATSANFLAYVDDGRLDDTSFYRAARRRSAPGLGFVQGGIRTDARRILPPFRFEPTSRTGIRHLDATISMARGSSSDSAGGNFFVTVGPTLAMDAAGQYMGYAAFGRIVAGMGTIKRILAKPTGGGSGAMKGQMIFRPVLIRSARRLDGTPKPTGRPKVWKIGTAS